jgi:hypothetical protein
MSDVSATAAPAAPAPATTPVAPAPEIQRDFGPSDAARMLAARRAELRKLPEEPAAPVQAAPELPQELADEANAAPQTEATSETQEANPAELPPIELPRSWTKEHSENWNALPRSVQEYLSDRASKDSDAVRRSQNEAAEVRKAAEAERQSAEQVRKQYEAKVASYTQNLEDALQNEFADIRSIADVRKMQAEDPFRYQQWDLRQKELAYAQSEKQALEQRAAQEQQTKRATYEAEQNKLLIELVPEMADPNKASDLRTRAVQMLNEDLGLSTDTLGRWMQSDTGHEILSNAGIQKLIADGLKYRDIKSAPKAVPQSLPPVQRPGVSKPAANSNAGKIQALEKQLTNTSGYNQARIMAEIRQLRRAR